MKFNLLALFTGIVVSVPSNPRRCGNEHIPSPEENARIMAEVSQYPSSQGLADTVIPVYFHIIMNANGTDGDLPSSAISRQISLLNSAYSPAGFRFETIEVDRTRNDEWFGNLDGSVWSAAGKSLRKGGLDALNIYSANLPDGTLGISQFPWDARNLKNTDGVRCATGTFPGGKLSPYNLGDTCVHEVGHWMGLYHTFQGGCRGTGDGVADTPSIAAPSSGCPVNADTCPGDAFKDDVRNFMDYSDDACMDHFSPGQNALMNQMWNRYRAQGIPATTTVVVTTKTTTTLTTTTRSTTTKTSSTFTRTSTTTKPISTPTTGTGTGIITFALGASYPTIEGDLIQGVEARLSYDIDRMGGACPMLRYCYQFGWISPSVCGTVPVAKSNSIPITFNYYGTAYLSFESFDADNICATDSTGFRGYSVYVKMPNKN